LEYGRRMLASIATKRAGDGAKTKAGGRGRKNSRIGGSRETSSKAKQNSNGIEKSQTQLGDYLISDYGRERARKKTAEKFPEKRQEVKIGLSGKNSRRQVNTDGAKRPIGMVDRDQERETKVCVREGRESSDTKSQGKQVLSKVFPVKWFVYTDHESENRPRKACVSHLRAAPGFRSQEPTTDQKEKERKCMQRRAKGRN